MTSARYRLATYGPLAPGRPNHFEGQVRGPRLPGLLLDAGGTAVDVHVFESADLPDEFEGPGYRRVATTVRTAAGDLEASIYVLRTDER